MLLLDTHSHAPKCRQTATVDAFCRQCGRGGAFYGAPFVTCLEGCCCKSCVIHKNWFSCLPGFISTNLRDEQIDFGLQPYLPGTSSFTKLLSCQHSPSHSALPPLLCLHTELMLFSLLLSLTVLHGKYLAADVCGWLLPGHVCLPLSSASTATQRENCSIHGNVGGVLGLVI